ncbi:MAG: hypothetical protein EPN61_04100 [Burkholderiaceae bacterium]|nr:MAG: hypothetical protein EPN61_04100 [Burkholderiaceae bacterium]
MPTNSPRRWWLHSATLIVWALAAASVVFWALKFVPAPSAPTALPIAGSGAPAVDPAAVARLLGANAAAPAAQTTSGASRYVLLGVVADREHRGAALIAVDGKPPKPFRVGATVDDGLLLQSVAPRRALLGPSLGAPASVTLDLPVATEAPAASAQVNTRATAAVSLPPGVPAERFLVPSPTGAPASIQQSHGASGAETAGFPGPPRDQPPHAQ